MVALEFVYTSSTSETEASDELEWRVFREHRDSEDTSLLDKLIRIVVLVY